MSEFRWQTSTYTGKEECVEVGFPVSKGPVGIRDTKQWRLPEEERPKLLVPPASFRAFIEFVK